MNNFAFVQENIDCSPDANLFTHCDGMSQHEVDGLIILKISIVVKTVKPVKIEIINLFCFDLYKLYKLVEIFL